MDSLQPLDLQLGELLAGTSRQRISQLSTQIGRDMRKRQRQRITAQQNPDGSAYKPRSALRYKPKSAIRFIYRKPNGSERVALLRSYRSTKSSFTGYDIQAGGIRTFRKERIVKYLPINGAAQPLRDKKDRIKNKMFNKIKNAEYLKIRQAQGQGQGVEVGFFSSRIARIARVHQYGLRDRPRKGVREVQYPRRELVGFSKDDEAFILDSVVKFLQSA